jgi:hypothetical protein
MLAQRSIPVRQSPLEVRLIRLLLVLRIRV